MQLSDTTVDGLLAWNSIQRTITSFYLVIRSVPYLHYYLVWIFVGQCCGCFIPINTSLSRIVTRQKKGQIGVWDFGKIYEKIVYGNIHWSILNNMRFVIFLYKAYHFCTFLFLQRSFHSASLFLIGNCSVLKFLQI